MSIIQDYLRRTMRKRLIPEPMMRVETLKAAHDSGESTNTQRGFEKERIEAERRAER